MTNRPQIKSIWQLLLLVCILAVGCDLRPEPDTADLPTTIPTAGTNNLPAAPTPIIGTNTPFPTNTPTAPTATNIPTLTPTATPKPNVQLYFPPELPQPWQEAVASIIGRLQANDPNWNWHITADPNTAQLTLQPGAEGLPAFQHPIALTIPFTTDWEEASSTQAADIIRDGHPLVTISSWEAMPKTLKALRIDGLRPNHPDYPLQQPWSLTAQPEFEAAAAQLTAELQTNRPGKTFIHLTAVGDIMLDRSLGGAIAGGNLAYPFEDVVHMLNTADITVGNLESALGDIGEPAPKSYAFQAPPGAAESLAQAGFDVVSLANNHGMDFGPEALIQGLNLLRRANVAPIGAGANATEARAPYFTEINGLRLAFLGYVHVPVEGLTAFDVETWDATDTAPGLAWAYPERITADVTAAKEQADLVIVILHSGFEYVEAPSAPQVAASYAAIDAGAALVIGHHAHILQGIEFYNQGVIVYGLGNFAFEIDGDPSTAILNVWLDAGGVHQLELIPAVIQFGGQPRIAEPYEVRPILQRVYFLTQLLNAG